MKVRKEIYQQTWYFGLVREGSFTLRQVRSL